MQKIIIGTTYYDDANGLYITPESIHTKDCYYCRVETITYNGDIRPAGYQLLTAYDLRKVQEVKR